MVIGVYTGYLWLEVIFRELLGQSSSSQYVLESQFDKDSKSVKIIWIGECRGTILNYICHDLGIDIVNNVKLDVTLNDLFIKHNILGM